MGYKEIREQIAAVVGAVEGIGVVHQYQRHASSWTDFLKLFKHSDGKINGWVVTRKATAQRMATQGMKDLAHIFVIRGYLGLQDDQATEQTFQETLGNLAAAFDADETLGETCLTISPDWGPMAGLHGLQIDDVDLRLFGNVLCHFAECRLGAIEQTDLEV